MPNQVQCPKCLKFKTQPYTTGILERESDFLRALVGQRPGFENPRYVTKFKAGEVRAKCDYCGLIFDVNTVVDRSTSSEQPAQSPTIEERLARLEQLRKKGLVTEAEYERKREALLREL
jgi:hypothetical protein